MSYCIFSGTDISIQTSRWYVTFRSKISSYIVQTTAYCLRREDLWLDARQFEEGVGSTFGIVHSGDSGLSVNYYSNLDYRCLSHNMHFILLLLALVQNLYLYLVCLFSYLI